MSAPQRVNVLLSRARDALIVIGNAKTFLSSRKGKETWAPLFEQLNREGHVYDGFPIKCERHPDRTATLHTEADFERCCPDGGCTEQWQALAGPSLYSVLMLWPATLCFPVASINAHSAVISCSIIQKWNAGR